MKSVIKSASIAVCKTMSIVFLMSLVIYTGLQIAMTARAIAM